MNRIQRNSLIAAACLAACGIAAAQSTVQLFGVVDAAMQRGTGSIASKSQVGNSGLTTSRWGLRGKEDLGGGNWAQFWLEAGLANDTGNGVPSNSNNQLGGVSTSQAGSQGIVFGRRSTIGLGGSWGEVRIGRDFTPQYHNLTYEPTGGVGVGTAVNITNIITGPTNTRASNAVSYFMPGTAGFFGQVQYYLGENLSSAPNKHDGNGWGLRLGYGHGPYEVAVATSRTKYLAGDSQQSNIGGFYDFGVAKLLANYSHDEGLVQVPGSNGTMMKAKANGWSLGTSVPVGSDEIRAGYSVYKIDAKATGLNDPEAKKLMASYVHNLSKRTAVYGSVARVSNSGGSATALLGAVTGANQHSNGYEAGIRHTF